MRGLGTPALIVVLAGQREADDHESLSLGGVQSGRGSILALVNSRIAQPVPTGCARAKPIEHCSTMRCLNEHAL